MKKHFDYRGHKISIVIERTDWHDIISGFQHDTTIRVRVPGLRCATGELNDNDMKRIETMYSRLIKTIIDTKYER